MTFSGEAQAEDQLSLTTSHVEASMIAGDRAEIRCVVTLHAGGARFEQAHTIRHLEKIDQTAQPTLALYITQPQDRLWDVMKHYHLSEKALKQMNEQEAEYAADAPLPASMRLIAYRR